MKAGWDGTPACIGDGDCDGGTCDTGTGICEGEVVTLSPSSGSSLSDVFSGLVDWLLDLFTFEDYVVLETTTMQPGMITGEVIAWEEGMEINSSVRRNGDKFKCCKYRINWC